MELIDTHCHLYSTAFTDDIDAVIGRAVAAGVRRLYLPAIDRETEGAMFDLENRYPKICRSMQGLHPCSVRADVDDALKHVRESLAKRPFVAVGEIGLDFYWDRSFENQQFQAFHEQIELAIHYRLPIVIHSRNSIEQTIRVVREHQKGDLRGVFHCFNEDEQSAKEIISLGFFIGIGGTVTYKKSVLPAVLQEIDLDHIVLETDSPYLPPVPYRGKRNESSYIYQVAAKLAELKNTSIEEVARMTTNNARKLFNDEPEGK